MRTLAAPNPRRGALLPSGFWTVLVCLLVGACTEAQELATQQDPEIERIADGFGIAESPLWHEDGYLLFVDVPGDRIYRWTPDTGVEVYYEPSGRANGLAFALDGSLVVAQRDRRLSRLTSDGRETVLAEQFEGKRLNSPNDLAIRSAGAIYFTDPPFGVPRGEGELGFNGVYRLLPDGTLELLADDLTTPNGIAFSPDERSLYVADSGNHQVRIFDVAADGRLANGRVFAELIDPESTGDPDGLEVDDQGNLYVAGPGGVWVYAPDGALRQRISIPEEHTTNLTWGGPDGQTLFVTAVSQEDNRYVGRLYRLRSQGTRP